MAKLAIASGVLAAAALAACTTYDPNVSTIPPNPDPMPSTMMTPAPSPAAYRPGYGVVEAVSLVRPGPPPYQLTLRMDDGTVQSVLQHSPSFRVGDRVQLTSDGRIIRV